MKVIAPHILQQRRRMAHQHAKKYYSWGHSAADWEDRVKQLGYNHVLPQRELNAIICLVWHL